MTLPQHFIDRIIVDDTSDCWLWTGGRNQQGYGMVGHKEWRGAAHRAVWRILRGDISKNQRLDHLCRIRTCVNPDHLEPVSQRINVIRGLNGVLGRNGQSSRFIGVKRNRQNRWMTSLWHDGVREYLGSFDDETAAAKAYDDAVRRHLGPNEPTNESLALLEATR